MIVDIPSAHSSLVISAVAAYTVHDTCVHSMLMLQLAHSILDTCVHSMLVVQLAQLYSTHVPISRLVVQRAQLIILSRLILVRIQG